MQQQQQRLSERFFSSLQDQELNQQLNESSQQQQESSIAQVQRKLLAFFYIYASIIISLYLTYAVYCYYQQGQFKRQQFELQVLQAAASQQQQNQQAISVAESSQQQSSQNNLNSLELETFQTKLESKIHLLERYIEVLALDLESTKARLTEREKCACSMPCSFNGTRYADGQSWRSKCDLCSCRAGKISCTPRECPKLKCQLPGEISLQLPGQCCPTCMSKYFIWKNIIIYLKKK